MAKRAECLHTLNKHFLSGTQRERNGPSLLPDEHGKAFGTCGSQAHYFALNYGRITRTNGSLKRSSKLLHYALNCCLLCT